MNVDIIEDLNWRYACKKFDATKKITDEDFNTLLDSLRLTASSFGLQPWKFVVVESGELREKLVDASWKQEQVRDASHLIVLCIPDVMDEKFVMNYLESMARIQKKDIADLEGLKKMLMMIPNKSPEKKLLWAVNQLYIALGNLMTTCASMRIDSCPMEGFKPKAYDEILGLSERGLKSVLVCPVGYRHKDDKYSKSPKVRYTLEELILTL